MSSTATSPAAIGARIPRRELKRLLSGKGRYIDDIKLPRMLHACFVRSPHPHAKVISIEAGAAKNAPGAPVIHPEPGENVAFDFALERGEPANGFAEADVVIEEELIFERQIAL